MMSTRYTYTCLTTCLAIYLCAIFAVSNLYGQEQFYSIDEGLSSHLVTSIKQDPRGLLWVGTSDGLNLFDGYEFKSFSNTSPKGFTLSNNFTDKILAYKNNKFLITYIDNLEVVDLIDLESFKITPIELNPNNNLIGIPKALTTSKDSSLLVLTLKEGKDFLIQVLNDKNQFSTIAEFHLPFNIEKQSFSFIQDRNDHFWIKVANQEIWELQANGRLINHNNIISNQFNTPGLKTNPFAPTILYEDQSGRIWLSILHKMALFVKSPSDSTFYRSKYHPTEKHFGRIWEDQKGGIFVTALENYRRYAETIGVYYLHANKMTDYSFLTKKNKYIMAAYSRDFQESIFIGKDVGLIIIKNNYSKVKTFISNDVSQYSRSVVMRGIVSTQPEIIYAAEEYGGWYKINMKNFKIDTIRHINQDTQKSAAFKCGKNIIHKGQYIWGVGCDQAVSSRIIRFDTLSKKTKVYYYQDHIIDAILEDQNDSDIIWLATSQGEKKGGLARFNTQTGRISPFLLKETSSPLQNVRPSFLYQTRDNLLWVGTSKGLFYIDVENRTGGVYQQDNENGLANDYVMIIHEDEYGKLWLGTANGLSVLNRSTNEFKNYNKEDGLPDKFVCGILPDDKGNYWLSTYNGLSYFDTTTELFRNFYADDGLSNNEFNRLSSFKDKKGRYYFGGVNGINVFYPEDLLKETLPPNPILTEVAIFDTSKDTLLVQENKLGQLKQIVIPPSTAYFKINFTLPHYVNADKNQFQIKMEGLGSDWQYLGREHSIRYNYLPAGNYTLKIKGADSRGNWSESSRDLKIVVQEVFYKTWWFMLLCFVVLTGLAVAVSRYQLYQRLKVEKIRTKLSSDLHDEVSGLLSGIAMQTDILQMTVQEDKNKERLKKMGITSRSAMSRMSDVIWSIDSRKDHLEDLLHRMQGHAEEILTPLQIKYNIEKKNLNTQKKLPIDLRQNLYFIFKEIINNVAKHSNAKWVDISLVNTTQHFIMTIHDKGTSAQTTTAKAKTGQGLSNLKMRAERIKADLKIDKSNGYLIQLKRKRI